MVDWKQWANEFLLYAFRECQPEFSFEDILLECWQTAYQEWTNPDEKEKVEALVEQVIVGLMRLDWSIEDCFLVGCQFTSETVVDTTNIRATFYPNDDLLLAIDELSQ